MIRRRGWGRRVTGAPIWGRRADEAEVHADALARALEFHVVNECDCHGAGDVAALRRHEIRRLQRKAA